MLNTQPLLSSGPMVRFPNARERQRLGRAVWVLLLLARWQDTGDTYVRGGASIRCGELAAELGVGERQVRRDLRRLRLAGYVELQRTGRGFKIRLSGVDRCRS